MNNTGILRFFSPRYLCWCGWIFVGDWWRSRHWKSLLWGLPAVLVIAATVGAIAWQARATNFELKKRYLTSVEKSLRAEDFDAADLALQKLIYLDPEDDEQRYELALVLAEQDELVRARELMSKIAPLDKGGYALAHFWLAVDQAKGKDQLSAEEVDIVRRHLVLTLRGQPDHADANAMLGQLFLMERQFDRAAQHLARAVDQRPELRLTLARTYAANGERAKSMDEARASAEYYASQVDENAKNIPARLAWAQATLFLENFERTVTILRQGLALEPDNRLRMMLAQVYLVWSDQMSTANMERKMELLQLALTYAPDNPQVISRLAPLASKENPQWQEVRTQLEEILARGKARSIIHFILGTLASEEQDFDKAAFHLEQAYQDNPRMAAVANNLAWVLSHIDPPQYERALDLCNAALEVAPNNSSIRETRGVIHLKMENWKAAIGDLEAALPGFTAAKMQRSVHENLATAYEKIGQPDLAARHRELAVP